MGNRHFIAPLTERERLIEGVEFIDQLTQKRCRVHKRRRLQRIEERCPITHRWLYWRHVSDEDRRNLERELRHGNQNAGLATV